MELGYEFRPVLLGGYPEVYPDLELVMGSSQPAGIQLSNTVWAKALEPCSTEPNKDARSPTGHAPLGVWRQFPCASSPDYQELQLSPSFT